MMNRIKERYGNFPNSIGLQEVMNYDVELSPVFGAPIGSDESVQVLHRRWNVTRGVATWGDSGVTTQFDPIDNKCEIVTTIHDNIEFYSKNGSRHRKVALINVYRLMHRDAPCATTQEIVNYINKQTRLLRKEGIEKVVIHGDFNEENVDIPGFRELSHPEAYHKSNATDKKIYRQSLCQL